MIKKKLILFVWLLLGFGAVALFLMGASSKKEKPCKGINVEVSRKAKQVFTDVQGIKQSIIEAGGKPGMAIGTINLPYIESSIKQNPWINHVKLYFDNDQVLQAILEENDPIARVFTKTGKSFYLDTGAHFLPTNKNIVARIPVFTGFPSDKEVLSKPDSAVLIEMKAIASFVINDTFWNSFIAQIDYDPKVGYKILPTVGNQIIHIGNGENLESKFSRLYSFYRQVISRTGLEAYAEIDVQYQGQVVAIPAPKTVHNASPPAVASSLSSPAPPKAATTVKPLNKPKRK